MAWIGGAVLSALVCLTCLSILGRLVNSALQTGTIPGSDWLLETGIGPILGDFELVEAGIAFAVFAFLPICQLTGSHAVVDVVTTHLPKRVQSILSAIWEVVFAAVLCLITAQLYGGFLSKMRSGQITFLLEMPVWWAYGLSLGGAVIAAGIAVYVACLRIAAATRGESPIDGATDS